jgi:hypothetical protein
MLESDGVHLKPAASDLFLSQLGQTVTAALHPSSDVTLIGEYATVNSSDDDDDDDEVPSVATAPEDRLAAILRIVKSNSQKLSSVKPLKDSIARMTEASSAFEAQVRLRRQRDNYVFARLKEDADFEVNRSREDRVVISGLPRFSSSSTTHQAKKDHYVAVVTGLVDKCCPDMDPKPRVVDVIVNIRRDQLNPSIEVRFDSTSGAFAFRKSAASFAKTLHPDFNTLFISNSVTQATRVRIEIMKAIAKKLTTTTEEAFVQGFSSRPMLRYLVRESCESFCSGTG